MVNITVATILSVALLITLFLAVFTLMYCQSSKKVYFILLSVSVFLFVLGYLLEVTATSSNGGLTATKVMYLGAAFFSPLFLLFAADYCEVRISKPLVLFPLLLIPSIVVLLVWTSEYHTLIYSSYYFILDAPIHHLEMEPGKLYYLNHGFALLCMIVTSGILIHRLIHWGKRYRLQLLLLVLGAFTPVIANFLYVVKLNVFGINYTPVSLVVLNLLFFINIIRYDLFDILPQASSMALNSIKEAFVLIDKDMLFLSANPAAYLVMPGLSNLHKGREITGISEWPPELTKLTDHRNADIRFSVRTDTERFYGASVSAVFTKKKEMEGWIILIQDITLNEENVALQRLDKLKDDFLANTSHELRTPLHGIIGITESLAAGAAGPLPERALNHIAMIGASGKRLASLVDDILDFSRLRHEEIVLRRQAVDMHQSVEVVTMVLRPLWQAKSLRLENKLPVNCYVDGDEGRIHQVLYNIIGNAIKFTTEGSIEVTAERTTLGWTMRVADTGIGIAPEQQQLIFESFAQGSGSIARDYGGTGLGLSISKKLVELHGGSLTVASVIGEGTTFSFELPAAELPQESELKTSLLADGSRQMPLIEEELASEVQEEAATLAQVDNAVIAARDNTDLSIAAAPSPTCILVVDDEPVNLQVLDNFLTMEGYRVAQASSAFQALALIQDGLKPDLILLDVMMPRMSGYELSQKLRLDYATRSQLPILLLTARGLTADLVEGFSSGANDYLSKPISRQELLARVKLHLQLAQWNSSLENEVLQRTLAIRNLLDEAGQGFLSLAEDMLIMPEYSVECERLFGAELTGQLFAPLIYPADLTDRRFLEELLMQIIHEQDELQVAVLLSLLPGEVEIKGKHVELQYKKLGSEAGMPDRIMVIMTDISDRRQLEQTMDKERRMLRMVVRVVVHYAMFKELTEEYRRFATSGIREILAEDATMEERINEMMRYVHTLKGNFAQLDFIDVVEKLHAFETQLLEWRKRMEGGSEDVLAAEVFAEWVTEIDYAGWLEADMQVLREMLGDQFADETETVAVKKTKLLHLQRKVAELFRASEGAWIVDELKRLHHKPLRDLLAIYPDYVQRLAAKLGKSVYPVTVAGGEFTVDHERYVPLACALSHVFANMVDHGIETPEDRASIGKDKFGTISCHIGESDGQVTIVIANDGSVIDTADIRRIALGRGLASAEDFDAASRAEQLRYLFHESFSTKRVVSHVSGRGFGLSAVKHAIDALHGDYAVVSDAEQGTIFRFTLPIQ
ncbi:ATP-binding protein [Paenibacillus piri]|uniref:Circadian input-output histidine kinase CikA n=1 Tax=Paenibacillus piri TaxID=2547395 RepID=A0A4R5KH46_9BACL|nr:ATP-binding protein [Paenibacillus piri]TDF94703.1 response regulator [Paenibacillus piri]